MWIAVAAAVALHAPPLQPRALHAPSALARAPRVVAAGPPPQARKGFYQRPSAAVERGGGGFARLVVAAKLVAPLLRAALLPARTVVRRPKEAGFPPAAVPDPFSLTAHAELRNASGRFGASATRAGKGAIQRRFNVGILEAIPERKASMLWLCPER